MNTFDFLDEKKNIARWSIFLYKGILDLCTVLDILYERPRALMRGVSGEKCCGVRLVSKKVLYT